MGVIVTRDQLAGIIGILEFGNMVNWMKTTADTTGKAALPALELASQIDLNNPEVQSLKTHLLAQGVISTAAVAKYDAYVAAATAAPAAPPVLPKNYRVARPANIPAWQIMYAPTAQVVEGVVPNEGYIFVNGDCSDPAAKEV